MEDDEFLGISLTPPEVVATSADKRYANRSGGKLFMRELMYRVRTNDGETILLPKVKLEVLERMPSWLPRRRRRRKRKASVPQAYGDLSYMRYMKSRRLYEWFRPVVELVVGLRGHREVTLVRLPEHEPLEWEGRCDACGALLRVEGTWTGVDAVRLPDVSGAAFMDNCTALAPLPSPEIRPTTRVQVSRTRFRLIPRPAPKIKVDTSAT
ncbi:MAG: hypothetical protein E6R03_00160 [Hyphomicrobiaceae bacterium]|nr:MAG: hypothetical protein E6R03_00160 [Hyphomicrobiaceae bacterium]